MSVWLSTKARRVLTCIDRARTDWMAARGPWALIRSRKRPGGLSLHLPRFRRVRADKLQVYHRRATQTVRDVLVRAERKRSHRSAPPRPQRPLRGLLGISPRRLIFSRHVAHPLPPRRRHAFRRPRQHVWTLRNHSDPRTRRQPFHRRRQRAFDRRERLAHKHA